MISSAISHGESRRRRLGRGRRGATLDTGSGGDYTLAPTTFTIAAGRKTGTATIMVTDDSVDDDDETIVIDAGSANPALTAVQLVLTITDNDALSNAPTPANKHWRREIHG